MKDDQDTCSTGSSLSGIYKSIFKTQTPVCMFYFSHPFGISTPSSANNSCNVQQHNVEEKKNTQRKKKSSKYTTTTYLVTEIQKNLSGDEGSQDECCEMRKSSQFITDRELLPWPKNLMLPPLIQLIEKKQGRKLPDIDAILRQVRKQAWNTPKSHHSHSFWSRGSSISSEDFSSLASPDSLNDKSLFASTKSKFKRKQLKKSRKMEGTNREKSSEGGCENSGSGHGKTTQTLLKRRYSVPEIIMRKYSLAQQKSYEESIGIYSTTTSISETLVPKSERIVVGGGGGGCCNGQSTNNKKPIPSQSHNSTTTTTPSMVRSPIKYFIPFSPQASSTPLKVTTNNSLYCTSNSLGGSGGFFATPSNIITNTTNHTNSGELSMRKQTLLRRMWSREFQHSKKYSGSWSPPLRKSTSHQQESRLRKFNTLPEFVSSSCEKCKELGVLQRDNDEDEEDLCENKEDKSQQTDFEFDINANVGNNLEKQQQNLSSASSSASTIIQQSNVDSAIKNSSSTSIKDSNGNNIIICMTALEEQGREHQLQSSNSEDMLKIEIDGNNNNSPPGDMIEMTTTTTTTLIGRNGDKYLKKQFSTQLDDEGFHPTEEQTSTSFHYRRLREEKLSEAEIDQYISQMLIDNLNNVIRTVNENLQANGEHNLVKIDYDHQHQHHHINNNNHQSLATSQLSSEVGEEMENRFGLYGNNNNNNSNDDNKFVRNQHEISIQMRNAKNGDTNSKNRNSNEPFSPASMDYVAAVERDISQNTDVNCRKLSTENYSITSSTSAAARHYFSTYIDKSVSEQSTSTEFSNESQLEVTALINTGTSYPLPTNDNRHPTPIIIPRVIGPKTESMEVNPSSSSAQEDDEFDGIPDSDDEDGVSDVDSLDDVVTIKAKKLNEIAHAQHKKAQALFRQTHLKGQAFFVPIVDPEIQPIDDHIIVADTMPEKLKERLILRERRREMKRQKEAKIRQWRMQQYIERKMEQMNVVNEYLADLKNTNTAFKVIPLPTKTQPLESNVYKRSPNPLSGGGWVPKTRSAAPVVSQQQSSESNSDKSVKSKKLRNNIGMLESYKIDARGNMQIQAPKPEKIPSSSSSVVKPKIKRSTFTSVKSSKAKLKTPSELNNNIINNHSRKSVASSKRTIIIPPTSSASSIEATDARRRSQVMKDVQQMSIYKNDLTPDPDSGPSRKMWKTEIQEGDKHIEILEIVECVDGNTLAQQAPEHVTNNFNHLFPPPSSSTTTQNHHTNFYNTHSSTHPMYVNKTFSVKTVSGGYDDLTSSKGHHHHHYASKIPIPVYPRRIHYRHQPFAFYDPSSPSNHHNSSSTDAEESITSAGSSSVQSASKVDRMIANLLMEALKSPDEIGIEFIKSPKVSHHRRVKRRSQSPSGGIDSSSTGYYTGDSSSRRSASNSAGKYQHRFEVIPEEKSSFSVDSSNDDFIEDEEEENMKADKINTFNEDWKSRKNLQNNDIKTRNSTPQQIIMQEDEKENENEAKKEDVDDEKMEEEEEMKSKPKISPAKKSPMKMNNNLKTSPTNKSTKSSPAKSIKSFKSNAESASNKNASSPDKNIQQKSKEISDTKSFIAFTENLNESLNEDILPKNRVDDAGDEEEKNTEMNKSEDSFHHNLLHQYNANNKIPPSPSTPSINNNNHFHYHLYQYQTSNCCFNLLDHRKSSSSTVTSAASNENFSTTYHASQSAINSCPLGVTDVSLSLNTTAQQNKDIVDSMKKSLDENNTPRLNTNESIKIFNIPRNHHQQQQQQTTPSSYDEQSRSQTASEKIIAIELTNETYRKPQKDDEQDDCSCTKKYLPYKVNERNVWQVYETSDCKYIQSKVEIDEIFHPPPQQQPPDTAESTMTSDNIHMLHSRSNFSNELICHAINHESNHRENAPTSSSIVNTRESGMYTPSFNIKPLNLDSSCHCNEDEEEIEIKKDDESFKRNKESKHTGKLLNRPKAINNISRDRIIPVEKEDEIAISGVVKNSYKNQLKPIKLPSPTPKQQRNSPPKRNNSYEDNSQSSSESVSSNELPLGETSNKDTSSKEKSKKEKINSSLIKAENKSVTIPNIHQGWSVTVAGTHPDLAPDVEMKISFPKAKTSSQSITSGPNAASECSEMQKPDHEVFYYKNNQIMPGPSSNEAGSFIPSYAPHKGYYNNRRSLSLARIDSGMSAIKSRSHKLPNLHVPRSTARNAYKQVECTTISASKTIIPNRRSLSLDHGNRRLSSIDSRQESPYTPSEMLSVVGESLKRTIKPKVKTMSERDLTKRHMNCFTRNNGSIF